jgi:quinol monooxygenase YgiN
VIIVIGSVSARPESRDEPVRLGLEHVHRSRLEPGCVLHSVHHDVEDPNRLVFIEYWADRAALDAHFAVPESGAFVTGLRDLTSAAPTIEIYEAAQLEF